jgi:hypothetical protein
MADRGAKYVNTGAHVRVEVSSCGPAECDAV